MKTDTDGATIPNNIDSYASLQVDEVGFDHDEANSNLKKKKSLSPKKRYSLLKLVKPKPLIPKLNLNLI